LSDTTRSRENANGDGADDGAKLKNQEGSKIYVKVRLLRILLQRGFQKSTNLVAPTAELNTCKNSSQWRYGKNLCKNLDPTPILAKKLNF
jgi:hypothetical protein